MALWNLETGENTAHSDAVAAILKRKRFGAIRAANYLVMPVSMAKPFEAINQH
jgi:hypothetical protein